MKKRQKAVIITHAVMYEGGSIHGPAHAVATILANTFDVSIISHPLSGTHESVLSHANQESKFLSRSPVGVRRWIQEAISTALYIVKNRPVVIITIDPINALPVAMLQAVGLVSTFIYYSVDFANRRSNSVLLNWIYHELDTLAAQSATQCWAVSKRILEYRAQYQGIESRRLFHVPNSPPFEPSRRSTNRDPNALVIVSNIHKGVGFEEIFSAFYELTRKNRDRTLTVIGGGSDRGYFENQVKARGLQRRVRFLGQLSHEKVHQVLRTAGIGLALYTGHDPHRRYSDSMKARDYLSEGLPVVISGDLGTAEEIEQSHAGVWIKLTTKNIVDAVETILQTEQTYKTYQKNALALARARDFSKMISIPINAYPV